MDGVVAVIKSSTEKPNRGVSVVRNFDQGSVLILTRIFTTP